MHVSYVAVPLLRAENGVFPCEGPVKFRCSLNLISGEDSDTEAGFSQSMWGFHHKINIPSQLYIHLSPPQMCYKPNQPFRFHKLEPQLRLRISTSPWLTSLTLSNNASLFG
jgi:hypothetical protein